MGRKPNLVATEFFIRGRKLDDASNRYEQTCKFCNERFPKGRVDTLIAHITKRCAAIPLPDRQQAIQLCEEGARPALAQASESHDVTTRFEATSSQTDYGLSGLEALAEVSSHHLDYQSHALNDAVPFDQPLLDDGDRPPAQKKRRIQSGAKSKVFTLPVHAGHGDINASATQYEDVTDAEAHTLVAALYEAQAAQEIDPAAEFLVQDDAGEMGDGNHAAVFNNGESASTALRLAASAASELIAPQPTARSEAPPAEGASTPFLYSRFRVNAHTPMIDPQLHAHLDPPATAITDTTGLRPLASRRSQQDATLGQPKQKARGKFSESRRKEVQDIRKLGACIRCRMLKKPCSNETPCYQCTKIEGARLWKHPCIRTKLQDEINLWSCGLFAVHAYKSMSVARANLRFELSPGRIEATLFQDAELHLTFASLKSTGALSVDYNLTLLVDAGFPDPTDIHFIATEKEDILTKVERYLHHHAINFHVREQDQFLKNTLETASHIALNHPAMLIHSVTELWLGTKILTGQLSLHIALNTAQDPADHPIAVDAAAEDAGCTIAIIPETNLKTYELINVQLLAAVEKRATALARIVLSELERRLIQRQQSHQFEIFVVSVILLACVEQMCSFYRGFDQIPHSDHQNEPGTPQAAFGGRDADGGNEPLQRLENQIRLAAGSTKSHIAQARTGATVPSDWPLSHPPSYYYAQSEGFADVLHMLLRMRDVIPSTMLTEAGIISVTDAEQHPEAKAWFDAVQLTDERLADAAREGGVMRWLGKLLGR